MADNTTLNAGTGGDTISTDDIGLGVKVQRVKVQIGTDGNAADVNSGNPLPVTTTNPGLGAIVSGQQAVTASAVALASNAIKKLIVKASMTNSIPVFIGPSGVATSTGLELAPNQSVVLDVSNSNMVFVVASTTGASVSWLGLN